MCQLDSTVRKWEVEPPPFTLIECDMVPDDKAEVPPPPRLLYITHI